MSHNSICIWSYHNYDEKRNFFNSYYNHFFLELQMKNLNIFFPLEIVTFIDIKQALTSCEPSQVFKSFSLPLDAALCAPLSLFPLTLFVSLFVCF